MEKYYRFAGVELAVSAPDAWMYSSDGMLAPFRVDAVSDPHRFTFAVTEEMPAPKGKLLVEYPDYCVYQTADGTVRYSGAVASGWQCAYLCAIHTGRNHTVYIRNDQVRDRISVRAVLNSMEAEHLIACAEGALLHCSCIAYEGKAILFTAPSGTGKSTQAELWRELRGARIMNGDRIAVCLENGSIVAKGIPFAGSSPYCENCSLPLAAVVYLGQAPKTAIRQMRGFEAFGRLWEGISVNTWREEDVRRVSDVVQCIAEKIPVYHLPCTPDESAVAALESAMRKQVSI